MVTGGVAAIAPDVILFTFGWRKTWLPEAHPLVRWHRLIHHRNGLILIWLLGWSTHIIADWFTHE